MTETQTDTPRVWIGDLAAYNAGRLHGKWTDATDLETLEDAVRDVLSTSPEPFAEEVALMDREGFGDLIGEYTPLEKVAEIGAAIVEHGEAFIVYGRDILGDVESQDISEVVEQFEEAYCGQFDSLKDYAEELADDIGAIPDDLSWPLTHIDWDAAARDLEYDGYREREGFTTNSRYVFRPV
jgi:antirestriction protein